MVKPIEILHQKLEWFNICYLTHFVQVWASKWNERAYKNRNHDTLCIGILIQEHIRADYAFVTYTNHPVSRYSSQIYTEISLIFMDTFV